MIFGLWVPKAGATNNPVPFITSISPVSATPGGSSFTLTVNGVNFVSASTVNWGSTALSTTYVSAEQLTASVTSTVIASGSTGWITVSSPGVAKSNVVYLPVIGATSGITVVTRTATVGSGPDRQAMGDFNGDGILDLAVGNINSGTVSILLGNGDGTFQTQQTYNTGTNTFGIAVGDVNGDGKLDLVVGNDGYTSNSIAVLLGNGDGTFQAVQHVNGAQSSPLQPLLVDVNGDGKLDIVSATYGGSSISVYLGNGDGTFQSPTTTANSLSNVFALVAGDFNHDGKIDLAVSGGGTGGNIDVLLGNGDGTFQSPVTYASGNGSTWALVLGDFNGDGNLDLVTSGEGSGAIKILLGNSNGTFQAAQTVASSGGYYGGTAGDLNGDGNLDLVTVTGGNVYAYFGNGDGTFQSPQTIGSVGGTTFGVVLGNFVTSGGLAVASSAGTTLTVFLQTVAISPSSLNFGSLGVGSTSSAQNFTVTNDTSNSVTVSGVSFTGTNAGDFSQTNTCSSALATAGTCTVSVTFTPGATGSRTATLSITDNAAGSPHTATVSGTGTAAPIVQLSSSLLAFGNQNDGSTSGSQSVTVTNNGNASLTSIVISVTGTNSSEFAQTNNCGSTLAQSASCSINVTFSPVTAGSKSASVQIADNAGNSPQSISLTGTGVALAPVVSLSGNSISFGNQSLSTSSSQQSVTLTNTGNASLTGISIGLTGADAADFAKTTTCGSTLAATANCSIGVTFSPSSTGARSASVSISDNASNSPQSVTLTGTGTQTASSLAYTQAAPSPLVAGSAIGTITVGVYDSYSALVTGSTASVQVTITGPNSFMSSQTQSAVSGVATFNLSNVHLNTDGVYTITATSTGLTPAVSTTTVTALLSSEQMVVSGFPSPDYANVVHSVTVTIEDSYGNVITNYTGTVTISTSDSSAVFSPSYTFTNTDMGTHSFGLNLVTVGTQSISATDGTLSGSQTGIVVSPRPQFVVTSLADDAGSAACDGNEACSLRSAINQSNSLGAGDITVDTTQFAGSAPWTTTLTNGVLELSSNITITGPGSDKFSVSGNNSSSVFQVDSSSVATISSLTVTNGNSSTNGGGISNAGGLTIVGIAVTNNNAAQNGGGIYNTSGVAINFSTVSGNTAGGNGGGIQTSNNFTLYDSTVSANTATGNGGGLDNAGSLYVTQDTIAGNTASDGAGIENETAATVTISQSTVSANTATGQNGGTVSNQNSNSGSVTITNSIVAGNTDPGGDCVSCGTQNSANLFNSSAAALKLAPLANNGGSTQTMMPATGSPAMGTGNVSLAVDPQFSNPLTSDQRGVDYVRVINGNVDLGSVQSNSGAALSLALSLPTSLVAGTGQSLTVTALAPGGNPAGTYAGTVHFTSSDANAQLPSDYTFTSADAGAHTFSVTLETAGSQTLAVVDLANSGLTASQTVTVGAGADFTVAAISGSGQSAIVGAAFATPLSVRVTDAYGNNVSGTTVVFTAPGSGPSGTFSGGGASASAQTNTSGIAAAPAFTANGTVGQFSVAASVQGVQASAAFTLTNTVKPDYSVLVNPSTLAIQAGQSGTAAFAITPVGGYSGTITLSCSGLPAGATCVFQPAQAVLDGSSTVVTAQLTVHTTGANGVLSGMQFIAPSGRPNGLQLALLSVSGGLIILMLLGTRRTRQSTCYGLGLVMLGLGCAIAIGVAGCGSTASPAPTTSPLATPAGQYSANVVATVSGGANTHTTSLTITVTQ
jgi:CSLREA domain-containing protein